MKVSPAPEFKSALLEKIAQREFSERVGVHNTDLIYCLNKQAMRKLCPEPPTDNELLLFSLGWATQRWLTGQDKDVPEKIVDGITVTLDASIPVTSISGGYPSNSLPWELKASFQSANRPVEENTAWFRQIMSQCCVTGTQEAYLTRLEIMGDWGSVYAKGSTTEEKEAYKKLHPKPTLSAYSLEFTKDELAKHWEWMKGRKLLYEAILKTKVLLPPIQALAPGMAFECGYCTKKEQCAEGKISA